MASQLFPSTEIGLPESLRYELPPSLSDSARSYSVHVAPDGITSVTGPAISALYAANSTPAFGAFTQQLISFSIPSGMSPSVFADPQATSLSFVASYTASSGPDVTGGAGLNLIGSGASWFDSLYYIQIIHQSKQ